MYLEIERARFRAHLRNDGRMQVTSIHPYDETEYHWALQVSESCWRIYRQHKLCGTLRGLQITHEDVAKALLKADREAHLEPRRAIW